MPEGPISRVTGTVVPYVRDRVDTDRIIPARFLKETTFEAMAGYAFTDERTDEKGKHPFDQPQYAGAEILVAGSDFGVGSSREHATHALMRTLGGIKAIVAESYGPIFWPNCVQNGIVVATADRQTINDLAAFVEANPSAEFTLDVRAQLLQHEGGVYTVSVDTAVRQSYLDGSWNTFGQLLENVDAVRAALAGLPPHY